MKRSFSIRLLAPVLLLLPVLIVSAVILSVTSISSDRSAERNAFKELSQIRSTATTRVDALMQTPVRVVTLNLDLLAINKLDPADAAGWQETLLAQSAAFPSLSSIAWGSKEGATTWVARYGNGGKNRYYAILDPNVATKMREYPISQDGDVSDKASSEFEFDPKVRPWYRSALEAGVALWSEPYAWAGDESGDAVTLGLSHSAPYITEAGELMGVVSADLNLNDLSAFLSGLRIGETGFCFIVDSTGRLIASSRSVVMTDDENELLLALDVADAEMAAVAKQVGAAGASDEQQRGRLQLDSGAVFTTRSSVGAEAGLQWELVTVVPEVDFMADAQRARRNTLLICAVVVLLTMGLGYLISRKLSKPVIGLEAHLKKIGEGEFDHKIDLRETQEFRKLSETVNQMSADLRERTELRRSLAMAMEVQQSLLPDELPRVDGLQVAGKSNYCDQTGGDYYDFLDLSGHGENSVSIVVGDVMGHGIAAAMLMATARGILRSRSCESGSTGELIGHLNEQLVQVTQGQRFMTMIMASIDARTRQISWASAGHDMPLIYDPQNKTFVDFEGGGLPLGVMAEELYEEYVSDPLPAGTIVAFVTDGVFEARNKAEEHYGKDRIMQLIQENNASTADEIALVLEADLEAFQAGTMQEDDITFVIVKLD